MTPPPEDPGGSQTPDDSGVGGGSTAGDRAATDGGSERPGSEPGDPESHRPRSGSDTGSGKGVDDLWSIDPETERTAVEQLVGDTATAIAAEGEGTDVGEMMLESAELTHLGETTGPSPEQATGRERRRAYGFVRAYFLGRNRTYHEFQRTLNRARLGTSYDRYLTRLVYITATVAVLGVLLGALAGWWYSGLGVWGAGGPTAVLGGVAGGVVAGSTAWLVGTYYPSYRMGRRRQRINLVFPDAIVFMYALSESGMTLGEIIERLAEADDAYGAVAQEFRVVHRDMELYGNDLYTSLRNARNLTPSENVEQFVDDLLGLLEAGGDLTGFLDDQSEQYFQRASEDQEDLLNFLALLGEVFIVGFVAAPLLTVVLLIVISLLGDDMLFELGLLIYALLPMAFVGFGLLLSALLDPYVDRKMTLSVGDDDSTAEAPTGEDSESVAFRQFYRRKRLRQRLSNPLEFLRASPTRTLALTGPLAVLYLGVMVWQGFVPLTVEGWRSSPVVATNLGVIVPLVGTLTPVAVLHEIQSRRRRAVVERFPNTLYVLSSANTMGISLVDGLGVVARTAQGYYARQLRVLQNDIRWNNDPSTAMLRFANRLDVPIVSRTLKLLAEGRRSTTDLSRVLRIAAEDTRNRFRLVRRRQQEMNSYVVVVLVGYLIFLGVIVILDQSYLTVVSEILESTEGSPPEQQLISDVPVDTYRLLFFHAVVVQALGTGLVSGLLTDNRVISGLKYTVPLLVLAAVAFTLI